MNEIEKQIEELNSTIKCYIAPSKIHGIGVFALRPISKGEKCYCFPKLSRTWYNLTYSELDKLRPEIKEIILARWPSIINGSYFQSPNDDVWLASFINHSSKNFNYKQSSDSATREIKKGEEILEDYRVMLNYKQIYPWILD